MKSLNRNQLKFWGAFLVGAVAMMLTEIASGKLHSALVFCPLFVVAVYIAMIYSDGKISEDSADSVYYLGFVFTLTALFFAMIGPILGKPSVEIKTIVHLFGIALSTTVVGLLGRIFLLGFIPEQTTKDTDKETYGDAMDELDLLREELRATVQALSKWQDDATEHWRRVREQEMGGFQESLATHDRLLSDKAAEFARQLSDAYTALQKRSEDAIHSVSAVAVQATKSLQWSVDGFRDLTVTAQQTMQSTLSSWLAEIGKVTETAGLDIAIRIEGASAKVVDASEVLADSIEAAAARLSDVRIDGVNRALKEAEQLIVSGFTALSKKASDLGDQVVASFPSEGEYRKSFEEVNAALAEAVKGNLRAMKEMHDAARETGALFARIGKEVKAAGTEMGFEFLQSSVHSLAQSIRNNEGSLEATSKALDQVTLDIERVVEGGASLATAIQSMGDDAVTHQKEVREIRTALNVTRDEMANDLASSLRGLQEVMKTLMEGMRVLRTEIKSGKGY